MKKIFSLAIFALCLTFAACEIDTLGKSDNDACNNGLKVVLASCAVGDSNALESCVNQATLAYISCLDGGEGYWESWGCENNQPCI